MSMSVCVVCGMSECLQPVAHHRIGLLEAEVDTLRESYALLAQASEETEIHEQFLAKQVDAAISALRKVAAGDPTPKTTAGIAVRHILKGEFDIEPAIVQHPEAAREADTKENDHA